MRTLVRFYSIESFVELICVLLVVVLSMVMELRRVLCSIVTLICSSILSQMILMAFALSWLFPGVMLPNIIYSDSMCTHQHWIQNKYNGESVLVSCGKCPACLQEKANKMTNKIRMHYNSQQESFFLTLTYDRNSAPYIKFEDIFTGHRNSVGFYEVRDVDSIPIYRDTARYYDRSGKLHFQAQPGNVVGHLSLAPGDLDGVHFKKMRALKWTHDHFGVIYYPDIQKFIKRLSINLKRHVSKDFSFDYFICTEYGPTTLRPHAHLLLFFPKGYGDEVRSFCVKSWPYADRNRTRQYIEWNKDASSYVSSYVNSSSYVPQFLSRFFPPRRSHSLFFGTGHEFFQLSTVLGMFHSGNFKFSLQDGYFSGKSVVRLLPSYIISRFFPKFKGFSRLSSAEIYNVMYNSQNLDQYADRLDYVKSRITYVRSVDRPGNRPFRFMCYDNVPDKDCQLRRFKMIIDHHYERVKPYMSRSEFALIGSQIWTRYSSFKLRDSLETVTVPWNEYYVNSLDCFSSGADWSFMAGLSPVPPNLATDTIIRSRQLENYFYQRVKQKKTTNYIMASSGHLV